MSSVRQEAHSRARTRAGMRVLLGMIGLGFYLAYDHSDGGLSKDEFEEIVIGALIHLILFFPIIDVMFADEPERASAKRNQVE